MPVSRRSPKKSSKRRSKRSPKKGSKRRSKKTSKRSPKKGSKRRSKKTSKRSPKRRSRSNSTRRRSLAYSRQRQGKTSGRVSLQTKRVKNSDSVRRPGARNAYDKGAPLGTRMWIPQPGGRIEYLKELRLRANGIPYWALVPYEEGGRSRPVKTI